MVLNLFYSLQALVGSSPNTLAIVFEIPCAPKHILYSDSSDIPKLRTILTIITTDAAPNNIFFTLVLLYTRNYFHKKRIKDLLSRKYSDRLIKYQTLVCYSHAIIRYVPSSNFHTILQLSFFK